MTRFRSLGTPTALVTLALACLLCGPASAQSGCRVTSLSDPPREILACGSVTITAEKSASYKLIDSDGNGRPEAVQLSGKGLLIQKSKGGGFQVLTPHAIASVRGTTWAVDVTPGRTSVFVSTGRVGVTRATNRADGVILGAGDGVDVEAGNGPLKVNRWKRERALLLLARFGR